MILTDCKSVYKSFQLLLSLTLKSDKRASIVSIVVGDTLSRGCSMVHCMNTWQQLVDSLTKSSASLGYLRSVLAEGIYQVVAESDALERRVVQRRRREFICDVCSSVC